MSKTEVRLWDYKSQKLLHECSGNISCIKFKGEKGFLAVGIQNKIQLKDTRSFKNLITFAGHMDIVNCIDIHPSGNYLMSCADDQTVKIWDIRQAKILYTIQGHKGKVTSAAFSPCGNHFVTGGSETVVMLWNCNKFWEKPQL